jgi:hypothetical protein
MLRRKELTNEEELLILEEGLKSRFWELFLSSFGDLTSTTAGVALNESKNHNRDWWAGKATGMKEALHYPGTRARDLKRLLEQKPKL